MDQERFDSDKKAAPPKSKRSKQPISDVSGTAPVLEAPCRKRTRRPSIEHNGKLKKRAKSAKLTTTATAACWKKTERPVVRTINPPASKSLATKLPTETQKKRPRRSTTGCAVSTTSESSKPRRHHEGNSDGFLVNSCRDLCARPHSARTSCGDRKRTMSSTSAGRHPEETSPTQHRSRSYSAPTGTLISRKAKRQRRAAQHALAAAKCGKSRNVPCVTRLCALLSQSRRFAAPISEGRAQSVARVFPSW
ncbi:hypothetical protein HPB50_027771 [Hyalomma asiaticum]|nr:hypothetical protein HPB50_027771 [Hyalomma asiaticum]